MRISGTFWRCSILLLIVGTHLPNSVAQQNQRPSVSSDPVQDGKDDIPFEVVKIWDAAAHNAFTDLIRWQGDFYCAFRIGSGHVPGESGEDGRIQLIRSSDGKTWISAGVLAEPGIDLRDPKLSVTPDQRLMILMGGSNYDGKQLVDRCSRVAFLSEVDKPVGPVQKIQLPKSVATSTDWLWRVTWHEDRAYGVVYQPNADRWGLYLVGSPDGVNFELVKSFELEGRPNESTIRFDADGKMHVVVRNESGKQFSRYGTSSPPYQKWNWNNLNIRLGGPDLLQLPSGAWLLGTREYGKTATTVLGLLRNNGAFVRLIQFPSGGDTSYPGMLIHDERLWFSYYSSHQGRTSIYLATVDLKPLQAAVDRQETGSKTETSGQSTSLDRYNPRTVFRQRTIPAGIPRPGRAENETTYGYRIPSLLVCRSGTILAFTERRMGLHDHAQNDLVLKRSFDNGQSWGPEIVVHEDGKNSINDPLTVQLESGRILLMFARFPYGRHTRSSGWIKSAEPGYDDPELNAMTMLCYSDDEGQTWSTPVDISRQVKHPDFLNANTPGAMIQLTGKPNRGRIITGLWSAIPHEQGRSFNVVAAYSDDGGKSWSRGEPMQDISGKGYPNECQIAEAANGDLVMILRNQGGESFRKKTISRDRGETWSPVDIDRSLPSVACMGSLIRGPTKSDGSWDLFATFPSNLGRKDGQIAVSHDHGRTWSIRKIIPGFFAYSTTQISPDGQNLLLFYETDNYKTETLLTIPLSELVDQG